MATTYQHNPLSAGRKIRVLLLQPSPELDSPVHCNLREIVLEKPNNNPYEALSYVWGETNGAHHVICDGKPLAVTRNCLTALKYLRLMTRERALWVDSICINMHSIPERNQQVKLMGDIYKNAKRVLIWLGEGNDETTKLIRRLRMNGTVLNVMYRGNVPASFSVKLLGMNPPMKQAFIHLLENEWFKRAWTLQELSLADNAILLTGTIGLEWKLFAYCVRYWAPYFSRHVWRAMNSIRTRELYQLWRQENKDKRKSHRASQILSNPRLSFISDLKLQKEQSTAANLNGVAFLQLSRFRQASDPRDKIYSLYHMMTDMGVKLRDPDYHITAQQLYEEVTFALIQSSRSLWILENVDSDERMQGLPSWVPDFSQETSPNELLTDYQHFYDGYSPSATPGHLILDGKILHVIRHVGEKMSNPQSRSTLDLNMETVVQRLARWYSMALFHKGEGTAEDAMTNLCLNLIHPNFEEEKTADKRQLIMDNGFHGLLDSLRRCYDAKIGPAVLPNGQPSAHPAPDQLFCNYWRRTMPKSSKMLVDEMISASLGHRLFLTGNGSFGLCKMAITIGDYIVLFPGTTAPMIIREYEGKFRVIGRGSIYGIPKGAWPHRAGEYGLDTFTLV